MSFLEQDHTNWNEYDYSTYDCVDFSVDLVASAESQNIKAWIASVEFGGQKIGHAFVVFETTDYGLVYIEPQADVPYVGLKVGQPLCDRWGIGCWEGIVKSYEYVQCNHSNECVPYNP